MSSPEPVRSLGELAALDPATRDARELEWFARVRTGDAQATAPRPVPPEEDFHAGALAVAVERAVTELPPRCREVFTLTRDQHLSYAEAADVLGISPKTVEIHMGRALSLLRSKLSDWLPQQKA